MFFYCKENDILISARSMKAARDYAEHRLSPDYGHDAGRADSLNLVRISNARAEDLDGCSITWEAP